MDIFILCEKVKIPGFWRRKGGLWDLGGQLDWSQIEGKLLDTPVRDFLGQLIKSVKTHCAVCSGGNPYKREMEDGNSAFGLFALVS